MKSMDSIKKIDVPIEHWDRLFAPSSCLVMITTAGCAWNFSQKSSASAGPLGRVSFH
jgi:hypothetical protein